MLLRRLLFLCIGIGVLTGVWVAWSAPRPERVVELALDYTSARRFAAAQGYDLDRLLAAYRAAGITTLLIGETSLYDLVNQGGLGYPDDYPVEVAVRTGAQVVAAARARGEAPPPGIRLDESYVFVGRNPALAGWLEQMLAARLGPERVRRLPDPAPGAQAIAVRAHLTEPHLYMPLGVLPQDVAVAHRHGFLVAGVLSQRPLMTNRPGTDTEVPLWRTADPAAIARTLPAGITTVYIRGLEVPGYPDRLGELAAALRERGVRLALWRNPRPGESGFPAGMQALAESLDLRAIRIYPAGFGERLSDWVTAVKDRDVRMLAFEVIRLSGNPERDLALQSGWVREVKARLEAVGFRTGPAPDLPEWETPAWARALLALAVAAGALVAAFRFWTPGPDAPPWLVTLPAAGAAGLLAGAPALALLRPVTGSQYLALAAAVIFPTLGTMAAATRGLNTQLAVAASVAQRGESGVDRRWRADFRSGLGLLIPLVLWSAAGAVLVHGLITDRRFWLELALFRGVKLSLVAPPVLFVAYWLLQGRARLAREAAALGGTVLRLGHVLAGAGALAVLALMVVRSAYAGVEVSGVTVAPVSGLELRVRDWLDAVLYARPRTKEILFGYPALFLAAYCFRRGWRTAGLAAVAAGAVGAASLVNTFAHAHIPAWLSALRSGHGLWLGAAAGGLLLAFLSVLNPPAGLPGPAGSSRPTGGDPHA